MKGSTISESSDKLTMQSNKSGDQRKVWIEVKKESTAGNMVEGNYATYVAQRQWLSIQLGSRCPDARAQCL